MTGDDRVIVLPYWMTKAFCRYWLNPSKKIHRPVKGDQRKRYQAIAEGVDWNKDRGYRLVWEDKPTE